MKYGPKKTKKLDFHEAIAEQFDTWTPGEVIEYLDTVLKGITDWSVRYAPEELFLYYHGVRVKDLNCPKWIVVNKVKDFMEDIEAKN
jgi:hypothetical protein